MAATKVLTGEVRLSYANLFVPRRANEKADPKYSVVLLIPKNTAAGKETYRKILAAQDAALEEGAGKFAGVKVPENWRTHPKWTNTLHDGDEDADLETNPEYAGHWFISISSNQNYKPGIVDRQKNEILDQSEVYSGCYARVTMVAFAFNTQGNKGVSFGLRNVQKLRDGEPFGGGSRAEDDFDALDDEDGDDGLL